MKREYRTIEELEELVGSQLRTIRISRGLDQKRLAALADVSVVTLSGLERGKGSSLRTLIAVARALERTDWLEALGPSVTVSPMQLLRSRKRLASPHRVSTRRVQAARAD
jgi:transcriptional regulator with XRE-family HTH domain